MLALVANAAGTGGDHACLRQPSLLSCRLSCLALQLLCSSRSFPTAKVNHYRRSSALFFPSNMASDTVLASRGGPLSLKNLHQNCWFAHEGDHGDGDRPCSGDNDESSFLQEIYHLIERREAELGVSSSTARDQKREDSHSTIVLQTNLMLRRSSEREEKLQAQLNELQMTMSESASEGWRKARLLKEQESTLCDLRSLVKKLKEEGRTLRVLAEEKSAEAKEMSSALAEALKRADELSSEVTSRSRPVQNLGGTEREQYLREVDKERRLRKLAEQRLKRQKKQLESHKSADVREIALMKVEICELTESAKDFQAQGLRCETALLTAKRRATEKDHEISRLEAHAESKERRAAGLSNELRDCRAQEAMMTQRLQEKDAELGRTGGDLEILRKSVHNLATHVGGLDGLQSLSDSLTRLQAGQGHVCAEDHREYRYITDCGVLLCAPCLREAAPYDIKDGAFSPGSQVSIELDCRWCDAGLWTWQPLPIVYSTGWIMEVKRLSSVVSSVVSSLE